MLSRKHYKAIAEIIKDCYFNKTDDETCIGVQEVANSLADYFKGDNPCFDRETFLKACFED